MKILSDDHRVPTRTKIVELEPDEWSRTDSEVLTAADNGGVFGLATHHFGGRVTRNRYDGKTVEVYIYND